MSRLIDADIDRIIRKKRLYVFIILGLIFSVIAVILGTSGLEQISYAKKVLTYEAIPLNCLLVYLAVFSEEFHTGTMQCVIGRGYSRRVIVYAKFADCLMLMSWYYLWFFLSFIAANLISGIGEEGGGIVISMTLWMQLFVYTLISILKAAVCMAITMIFLFLTWNVPLGMLVMLFLALLSDVVTQVAQSNLDLPVYDISANGLFEAAYKRIIIGGVGWQVIPAVLIYVGVPIALTCLIFQNKEVDL